MWRQISPMSAAAWTLDYLRLDSEGDRIETVRVLGYRFSDIV
jgi:hypothetical protein